MTASRERRGSAPLSAATAPHAAVSGASGETAPRRPRLFPKTWVPILVLALVISSDYKFRLRPATSSLTGRPDLQTMAEVGIYAAVASFLLLQLGALPSLRRTTPLLLLAWGWAGAMAVSCLWAVYPAFAAVRGVQLLVIAGLAQAIATHARREHLHLLAHAFIALVVVSSAIGVARPFPGHPRRFDWLYVHPVVAGTYLGLAVTIIVAYLVRSPELRPSPSWPTWAYVGALTICMCALVATRTRGAMGAAVIGTMAALLLSSRRPRRIDIAAVAVVLTAVALLAFGPQIGTFLSRGADLENLVTFNGRTQLWSAALQLFEQRPVLGYGLTASSGLFLDVVGLGGGHNAFINVLTDGGLLGSALWTGLIVGILVTIRRLWAVPAVWPDLPMLAAVMAFFLVNSITYEGLGDAANLSNVWCYVIVGWLGVLGRQARLQSPLRRPNTPRSG